MKLNTNFLFFNAILSYLIPILFFGHWTIYNAIWCPISVVLIGFFINYKIYEKKEWPTYIYSFLHGLSISIYGITILGFTHQGDIVKLSIYWGILVYLASAIPFVIFSRLWRERKYSEWVTSFNDDKSRERDMKINKLLGIRF